MAETRMTKAGVVAVTLAVIGGILALANEGFHYRRSGVPDWGHLALAVGGPALIYALVRSVASRSAR